MPPQTLGRRIPEDVAPACFDESSVLVDLEPLFTVMAQPALNFGTPVDSGMASRDHVVT